MRSLAFLVLLTACGGSIATIDGPDAAPDSSTTADASTTPDASTTQDGGTVVVDASTPGIYSAVAQPGGLDHLFVQKKDVGRNLCFRVHLVHPSAAVNPNFKVPQPWGPAQAVVIPDAKACDGPSPISAQYTAKEISGFVTFTPPPTNSQPYPKLVTIQATLTFANAPAPIAPQEILSATDIPVTGI